MPRIEGPGITVIVCGGRDFTDRAAALQALDAAHALLSIGKVIEGGQRTRSADGRPIGGGDFWANVWSTARGIPCRTVPSDWKRWGGAAGPIRNREMLKLEPDAILALPGGPGTEDMMDQGRRAGVLVVPIGPWSTRDRVRLATSFRLR